MSRERAICYEMSGLSEANATATSHVGQEAWRRLESKPKVYRLVQVTRFGQGHVSKMQED